MGKERVRRHFVREIYTLRKWYTIIKDFSYENNIIYSRDSEKNKDYYIKQRRMKSKYILYRVELHIFYIRHMVSVAISSFQLKVFGKEDAHN